MPLLLVIDQSTEKNILWQNSHPASIFFYRLIIIKFLYETATVQKVKYIENQINTLTPTFIIKSDSKILIKHDLLFFVML